MIKLHRCSAMWVKIGGHPCWRVQKALDESGTEYEVVQEGSAFKSSSREKTIEPQLSFEMPCRRDHQAAAMSNGRETAQRIVVATTPVMIPAFTGRRPSERARRGPRRTSTTSVPIPASVPSSQS